MKTLLDRRQHSISAWVATINCEGTAFVTMLFDVPVSKQVEHTRAKMLEINRARARRIADRSNDASYRSVHEIRDEQIMMGEMMINQIAADVCHALLNLESDPWETSNPKPEMNTQTDACNVQSADTERQHGLDPTSEPQDVRIEIPSASCKYASQFIAVDGESLKVLASVVTALRTIAQSRAGGARIRTGHFENLAKVLPWLAKMLTRDHSKKIKNKLAAYIVSERVKKTIRVKTVSNELC